jgi:hypothetical protein
VDLQAGRRAVGCCGTSGVADAVFGGIAHAFRGQLDALDGLAVFLAEPAHFRGGLWAGVSGGEKNRAGQGEQDEAFHGPGLRKGRATILTISRGAGVDFPGQQ